MDSAVGFDHPAMPGFRTIKSFDSSGLHANDNLFSYAFNTIHPDYVDGAGGIDQGDKAFQLVH
ncbi:MAG: hypothetical protein GY703_22955, partial [Gammaproteobacteria bacterium]|nr:hypothetical protein [Gammaproteobacteria bacterium]